MISVVDNKTFMRETLKLYTFYSRTKVGQVWKANFTKEDWNRMFFKNVTLNCPSSSKTQCNLPFPSVVKILTRGWLGRQRMGRRLSTMHLWIWTATWMQTFSSHQIMLLDEFTRLSEHRRRMQMVLWHGNPLTLTLTSWNITSSSGFHRLWTSVSEYRWTCSIRNNVWKHHPGFTCCYTSAVQQFLVFYDNCGKDNVVLKAPDWLLLWKCTQLNITCSGVKHLPFGSNFDASYGKQKMPYFVDGLMWLTWSHNNILITKLLWQKSKKCLVYRIINLPFLFCILVVFRMGILSKSKCWIEGGSTHHKNKINKILFIVKFMNI